MPMWWNWDTHHPQKVGRKTPGGSNPPFGTFESKESSMKKIKFSASPIGGDRKHYVNEHDILVLLQRLPEATYERLKAVHFNDHSRRGRIIGYVNMGHREIALCALPPRVSLGRFLHRRQSPSQFGARRAVQWPLLAVRRFMLYDVFLHELGHLQLIDEKLRNPSRKFAGERYAQEFADFWRATLWSQRFDHEDPVHNRPAPDEFMVVVEQNVIGRRQVDSATVCIRGGFLKTIRLRANDASKDDVVKQVGFPLTYCHGSLVVLPDRELVSPERRLNSIEKADTIRVGGIGGRFDHDTYCADRMQHFS